MAGSGIKTRSSIIRLMLALAAFTKLLTMIKGAYHPRTYRQDFVLALVVPAHRNETALKTHAQQSAESHHFRATRTRVAGG